MHICPIYGISKHLLCAGGKGLDLTRWIAHPGGVERDFFQGTFLDCDRLACLLGEVDVSGIHLNCDLGTVRTTQHGAFRNAGIIRIQDPTELVRNSGNGHPADGGGCPGLIDLDADLQISVHSGIQLVNGTLSGIRCQLRPGVVIGHLLRRHPVWVLLICDVSIQSILYFLRTSCWVEI